MYFYEIISDIFNDVALFLHGMTKHIFASRKILSNQNTDQTIFCQSLWVVLLKYWKCNQTIDFPELSVKWFLAK